MIAPAARHASPMQARQDRPLAGIACMVGGMFLLLLSDAAAKWLTAHYPVSEIVVVRALVISLLLAAVGIRTGTLRVVDRGAHLLRGALAAASGYLFVVGLAYLPLAEATAAAFAGPLFLAALAGPLLGERVGPRRWAAVLAGFAGVVLMLGPTGEGLHWLILLPVAAACCGALRDIVTRRISVTENATSLLFTTNVVTAAAGVAFAASWTMPEPAHLGVLVLSALLIGAAHYLHIEAFRLAEAATVAPFRYTGIVWGVLFGAAFFGQLPGPWVVAGSALVIGSGLYIMQRERSRKRRAASAAR